MRGRRQSHSARGPSPRRLFSRRRPVAAADRRGPAANRRARTLQHQSSPPEPDRPSLQGRRLRLYHLSRRLQLGARAGARRDFADRARKSRAKRRRLHQLQCSAGMAAATDAARRAGAARRAAWLAARARRPRPRNAVLSGAEHAGGDHLGQYFPRRSRAICGWRTTPTSATSFSKTATSRAVSRVHGERRGARTGLSRRGRAFRR